MDLNNFAKEANNDMVWKAGEIDEPSFKKSPVTLEEVFQNLEHKGEDKNFLEREAHKAGVDFDEDTKDQFNRESN